jgi:UDP-3-O-[3-hydroxymyristoyl] glucosamine N-acyltransferase LpxD
MKFKLEAFRSLYNCSPSFAVNGVSQASNLQRKTISFALKIDTKLIKILREIDSVVMFIPRGSALHEGCYSNNLLIEVINPRYDYIKTTRSVFDQSNIDFGEGRRLSYVHPSSLVAQTAELAPFCFIGPNCVVEDNCILEPGVRLLENVHLGKGTKVYANSVIGGWGFGIERDNEKEREVIPFGGKPLKMPHYGGVVIGKNCEIGALTTICAGAIEPTILESDVMVDDHVHIAHNCKIRQGACVTACAEISGSVEIGEEAWIGPNAALMQKISIGPRSIIGLGSVVRKSTSPDSISVGNPAKQIRRYKR